MSDTLEVIDLDSLLSDDVPCEAKHTRIRCTVAVTHRLVYCKASVNVCHAAVAWIRSRMDNGDWCSCCGRLGTECWRLVPA